MTLRDHLDFICDIIPPWIVWTVLTVFVLVFWYGAVKFVLWLAGVVG